MSNYRNRSKENYIQEASWQELYILLDENPSTIPSTVHPKINVSIMEDYLESLKQYIKTHKKA